MRARLFLLLVATSTVAAAQPVEQTTREAKRRFAEGLAAADRGNFDAARTAFQQAYAIKPTPAVRRNLGEAELRTGRYLAAARDIAGYLFDAQDDAEEHRASARDSLLRAEAQVGKLLIVVDDPAAVVLVDGAVADWHRPVYLDPDQEHSIRADSGGRFDIRTVTTSRGQSVTVELRVLRYEPASAPSASALPSVPTEPMVVPPPTWLRDVGHPAVTTTRGAPAGLLVGGGVATIVGLGIGIAYTLRASAYDNDAQVMLAEARTTLGDPNAGTGPGCSSGAQICTKLDAALDGRSNSRQIAIIGFAGAAVFGAATLGALALWPKHQVALNAGPTWVGARGAF